MPKYLMLGKYSVAGAQAVAESGLTARKKAVEELVNALGMQQLGWWGVAEPEWDFVIEVEGVYTPESLAALSFLTQQAGAYERTQVLTLVGTEAVDAAQAAMAAFRPPGR